MSGFDVQLDCGYSCPVLAAVMLFFHEQVQLVQAVENGPILLKIIGERLAEPDECQTAFMFYVIAHGTE